MTREKTIIRTSIIGIIANVFLAGFKAVIGLMTNSIAIVLDAVNHKKKVTLSVHDTGIGIDPKYHGKIFAKFVQLDSAYTKKESSTGLGLTITKELVELHGGKISVKSEVNNGSTFIIDLPVVI